MPSGKIKDILLGKVKVTRGRVVSTYKAAFGPLGVWEVGGFPENPGQCRRRWWHRLRQRKETPGEPIALEFPLLLF